MIYVLSFLGEGFKFPDFTIDQPTIPEALPEMPAEGGEPFEETEFEEVVDAEVGEGAEVSQGKWDWSRVEQVEQFCFYTIHVACEILQAYPLQ